MGMITVEAEVEIDPVDVLHQVRTDDLREELKNREGGASDLQDPLVGIWQRCHRHGEPLDQVVDDLMRERGFMWRPAGRAVA